MMKFNVPRDTAKAVVRKARHASTPTAPQKGHWNK